MRNAQKQEVLDCIESLHQAHEEIKNALNGGDCGLVQSMLSQCQEFAVSLGENIEKLEGEGHVTVACLEAYCETLYHVYEELGSCGAGSGKIYKTLRKRVLKVESSAKNDIRVRKEVVFLPYKASMWDSLESVWKAADEDPDCDAYVIPIPYYDKNSDGSFGERHYEADLYPAYVPVVSYRSYDFEKRRPDMIFIHNPYDECNFVTSVDPFFYSKNLKKYTEKLVYIPYFILNEIDPGNKEEVECIAHFVTVPGVMNADRVIVQSEAMRQSYITVMTQFAGKRTRKVWEEKILGLGSPKVDKVLNTKKEDLEIPEEWLRVIRKPDGNWKKIVFYNIGVNLLLQYNEKWVEKIEYDLRIFKENKEKIALVWRPHPLIESTMGSMRPQILRKYAKLKDQYIREGWGIFDDTSDLDRAVVISDAYYGNPSSVVQLFCALKKIVLLQYIEDEREDISAPMPVIPRAISGRECDEYILDFKNNYLYKHCGDGECEFVSDLERGKGDSGFEYTEIINLGDDIAIVPNQGKAFLVYNTRGKSIRHIYVDKKLYENNVNAPGFHKIIPYRDKMFVIKYVCNAIACIDKNTLEITYTNIFDDSEQEWNLYRTVGDCFCCGSSLYIPMMNTNIFVVFDMENCSYEVKHLYEDIKIATICGCGDEMYIVEMCGKKVYTLSLSRWKIINAMNISEPHGFVQNVCGYGHSIKYIGSIYYKRQLWLIPYGRSNMVVGVDLAGGRTKYYCLHDDSQVLNYIEEDGILRVYTDKGSIKIDMNTLEVVSTEFFHSQSSTRAYWIHKLNYDDNIQVFEEQWLPLKDYIEYVAGYGQIQETEKNRGRSAGTVILGTVQAEMG